MHILLSEVYCVWQVVKTPIDISNNPVQDVTWRATFDPIFTAFHVPTVFCTMAVSWIQSVSVIFTTLYQLIPSNREIEAYFCMKNLLKCLWFGWFYDCSWHPLVSKQETITVWSVFTCDILLWCKYGGKETKTASLNCAYVTIDSQVFPPFYRNIIRKCRKYVQKKNIQIQAVKIILFSNSWVVSFAKIGFV